MISGENSQHKRHAGLARPSLGNFGRNEWAIAGAQCNIIKDLAGDIIKALSPVYNCAYVDTAHNEGVALLPVKLANGAALDFTSQGNYTQLCYKNSFNDFKLREIFAGADLVIANGNHHQAKAQIVIISENKRASLKKRLPQLTNVQLILMADDGMEVFDFIKEAVPYWGDLPVYHLNDTKQIIEFFKKQLQLAKPMLNGLVLAGGKSQRMGFDKGTFNWHGKEQQYYMADMLKAFCDKVYISCRPDQQKQIEPAWLTLPDTFAGLGPFGAILSAFREFPDSAWLVVACDLPLLTERSLNYLVQNRNISTIATAFKSGFNEFPEPLITIWEPKSYPALLSFLSQGYSCPRKVLINSDTAILIAPDTEELTNVNTPEELKGLRPSCITNLPCYEQ